MKRNLYYANIYRRQNVFKKVILALFYWISSYPRLILEVFIRRSMGERYFTLASALTVAFILLLFPPLGLGYGMENLPEAISDNKLWYLFTVAFIVFSFIRWREIKREPSVFDFGKFSMSMGVPLPIFDTIKIKGEAPSPRTIRIWLEPLPFFVIGFILLQFGVSAFGILLMVCAIIYSMSFSAAYTMGDNFVMDKIDEMIMNEEMVGSFVDGAGPDKTRGVEFYTKRPQSHDLRQKISDAFIEDDDDDDATEVR